MSYESLHYKYRPQTFANLVGEAIATTLRNAIRLNICSLGAIAYI
jgi:DNA polymerase-3 subunit gamma/tau